MESDQSTRVSELCATSYHFMFLVTFRVSAEGFVTNPMSTDMNCTMLNCWKIIFGVDVSVLKLREWVWETSGLCSKPLIPTVTQLFGVLTTMFIIHIQIYLISSPKQWVTELLYRRSYSLSSHIFHTRWIEEFPSIFYGIWPFFGSKFDFWKERYWERFYSR